MASVNNVGTLEGATAFVQSHVWVWRDAEEEALAARVFHNAGSLMAAIDGLVEAGVIDNAEASAWQESFTEDEFTWQA